LKTYSKEPRTKDDGQTTRDVSQWLNDPMNR
jgi:hypothetical protein